MTGSGELGEMKREMTGSCGLRLCRAVSCRVVPCHVQVQSPLQRWRTAGIKLRRSWVQVLTEVCMKQM